MSRRWATWEAPPRRTFAVAAAQMVSASARDQAVSAWERACRTTKVQMWLCQRDSGPCCRFDLRPAVSQLRDPVLGFARAGAVMFGGWADRPALVL